MYTFSNVFWLYFIICVILEKLVVMYVNGKMRPVEIFPGKRGGGLLQEGSDRD
jgi:hypothetical protein